MKVLKNILIVFAVIAAITVIVGLFLPSEFKVEKSKLIEAPQEELFAQVNDVTNWGNWNAWNKIDPNWKVTYSDDTKGEGAWYSWVSEKENVGSGKVTITKSEPNSLVEGTMKFGKMKPSNIYHRFEPQDNGKVKVVFGIKSDIGNNILMKYVFNVIAKSGIAENYEQSLSDLETYVLAHPLPQEPVDIEPEIQENDSIAKQDATEVKIID